MTDTDYCWFHGYEPIGDSEYYKICGECGHMFRTEQELINLYKESVGIVRDGNQIYHCPLCAHDF